VTRSLAWVALLGMTAASYAAEPDLTAALLGGKPKLNLRMRIEEVRDDALARSASAPTFRARFNYETLSWHHSSLLLEVDHLGTWGGEAYNSTRNGRTDRPQVPDPRATDLNQAALKITTPKDDWVLGRQRIALDNHRLIGGSAWRQNEQTFDALTVRTRRLSRTLLSYSYLDNVNRVFGPDAGNPPPDLRLQGHLLGALIDLKKAGKLSVFGQSLDIRTTPALAHQNVGFLWTGSHAANKTWSIPWTLSAVQQQDAGRNPTDYSADYYKLELGAMRKEFGVRAGLEVLGGDATRTEHRFQTPLATLHAFQGWADKFLTTPPQGVQDFYVDLSGHRWGLDATVVWHDFRAEATSQRYGDEWDISVSRKFSPHFELLLKAANYRSAGFGRDTRKLWVQFSADYP